MKTELRVLFCSPIAWLILIVFAVQAGVEFCGQVAELLREQALGYKPYAASSFIFGGYGGVMTRMLENLYLYIPLLTMGLMSRELSSGSIKLLYSSPVSNVQIILGKYVATLLYGLGFVAILLLEILLSWIILKDFDIMMVLVALLGLYLTVCVYAAIGLFMSTITQYQVVAAIGTLAILAVLNFIGNVGQEIDFVRDLTYWLSIADRSKTFMDGLVNSADLLYFLLVILMFLALSVIKLNGERSRTTFAGSLLRYGAVLVVVLGLGYLTSQPKMVHYYDGTQTKRNTLTEASQQVVSRLTGGLTMTTYVNMLEDNYYQGMPSSRNYDLQRFENYLRFKPEMKIRYVYYYHRAQNAFLDGRFPDLDDKQRMDTLCKINDWDPDRFLPYEQVASTVDLSGERFRFVRLIERENGQRVFLRLYEDNMRQPGEAEISTALKTLVAPTPRVGFVTGHEERSIDNFGIRGYGLFAREVTFRYSLINEGFRAENLSLAQPVDPGIDILVISDMRRPFSQVEMRNYLEFLTRGGNLVLLGEPRRQENMDPLLEPLGLRFTEDMLVRPTREYLADVMVGHFTEAFGTVSTAIHGARREGNCFATVSACGVESVADKGFRTIDCIVTDSLGVWNERQTSNFVDEIPTCDPQSGEVERPYSLMKYLTRDVDGREQRIVVIGDSDSFASSELNSSREGIPAANFTVIQSVFKLMSYGEFPMEIHRVRPPDDHVRLTQSANGWLKTVYCGVIPGAMLLLSVIVWIRRRNK